MLDVPNNRAEGFDDERSGFVFEMLVLLTSFCSV
jgi:hypothetical protein